MQLLLLYQISDINLMTWPKTGATHYHAQVGLPEKGRAIKVLVVCYLLRAHEPAKWSGPV